MATRRALFTVAVLSAPQAALSSANGGSPYWKTTASEWWKNCKINGEESMLRQDPVGPHRVRTNEAERLSRKDSVADRLESTDLAAARMSQLAYDKWWTTNESFEEEVQTMTAQQVIDFNMQAAQSAQKTGLEPVWVLGGTHTKHRMRTVAERRTRWAPTHGFLARNFSPFARNFLAPRWATFNNATIWGVNPRFPKQLIIAFRGTNSSRPETLGHTDWLLNFSFKAKYMSKRIRHEVGDTGAGHWRGTPTGMDALEPRDTGAVHMDRLNDECSERLGYEPAQSTRVFDQGLRRLVFDESPAVSSGFCQKYHYSRTGLRKALIDSLENGAERLQSALQQHPTLFQHFPENLVENLPKAPEQVERLVVTGHSLGGAAAKIAHGDNYLRLLFFPSSKSFREVATKIASVTFAAPPAVNWHYANMVNDEKDPSTCPVERANKVVSGATAYFKRWDSVPWAANPFGGIRLGNHMGLGVDLTNVHLGKQYGSKHEGVQKNDWHSIDEYVAAMHRLRDEMRSPAGEHRAPPVSSRR